MSPTQAPVVSSIVLADAIHADPLTRRLFILGTLSRLSAPSFPFEYKLAVYAALTNGTGSMKVQVRMVSSRPGARPLFERERRVEFADRADVREIYCEDPDARFEEPGDYWLQVTAGQTLLGQRRVVVYRSGDGCLSPRSWILRNRPNGPWGR